MNDMNHTGCFFVIVVVHGDYPPGDGYISYLGKFGKSSSNMPFFGGYVSFMVIHDVKCHAATVFLGGGGCFFNF